MGDISHDIGTALDTFGGFLRCEVCGKAHNMAKGDAGFYTENRWPKHCGYTMRWWTQNQIDQGDVPPYKRYEASHDRPT